MTAEVFPESAYVAFCEECDWEGETTLDEGDAKREAAWHNERCTNGGDPDDPRTERERFQDQMDEAMTKGVFT